MMKLLYPDGKMTDQEAYELVDFAAESRKRVKDQLYVIDETFKAEPAHFKYINLRTVIEMNVETLEKVSNPFIIPINSTTGTATGELTDADAQPLNEEISRKMLRGGRNHCRSNCKAPPYSYTTRKKV